ncbi:type 1 glutamine amidotransferase domain-containing protein [Pontibacter rugosus]|uniref:Type 1 glutamine amidotransferase domain-containing protein n=1 Tax=Pontibacter rugosus TaxID=1745966 RepID=A0ABW3SM54_9BACT
MKVLFVLTSHAELGDTGKKTGFWVEEFAAPYYVMADAGVAVTLASPAGGAPPVDPSSEAPGAQTEATERYNGDQDLQNKLMNTTRLSDIKADDYDAVFYPGGHGPLWDLTNSEESIKLIEAFAKQQKPVAAVCHAPAVFAKVKNEQGESFVKGKNVTGFTNSEEEAVNLTDVVPFLVEEKLQELGGNYSKVADWQPHIVRDGLLITGQNPASSEGVAEELLKLLKK